MQIPRFFRSYRGWLIILLFGVFISRYFYFLPRYNGGEPAPEFKAVMPNGQLFQLSELRGKYVLLHFWGSWCGPCRRENPALVELYQRFGGEKFAIVSIAIERDGSRWAPARLQDGLNWPWQFMEITPSLRFFDAPIANLFGVKKLPTCFLLSPAGEITASDPSIADLEALLKEAVK